ncbi:hypothetical protein [Gaetbulibacter sp. NE]|uniref:hypothetical protein n=1 Tax=Gaetbulibacter sp. NE TaxID=2982307 RepID=UPI0021D1CF9A|nr:hypothetical protein [Gaetbulibacter sp. NE]
MNIDKIIYVLLFIPFLWILIFDQQKLKKRTVFIKYLLISIGILMIGILYQNHSETENRFLVYIGSQMTLIFLILFKIIRIPYFMIFKREPEFNAYGGKWIDKIITLIITIGTVALPLLIDSMIFKKVTE